METIKAFMKQEVVTADPGETVEQVVARMVESGVGAVVLVEGGELAGLFSERDFLKMAGGASFDPASTKVGEVATRDVVTTTGEAKLRDCAELLRSHNIRHLPIVEGRKAVGMVSARDFFDEVAGQFEKLVERARYDEQLREDVDPYDHVGGSYGR